MVEVADGRAWGLRTDVSFSILRILAILAVGGLPCMAAMAQNRGQLLYGTNVLLA